MFLLFEDSGKFQVGRILSEAESSAQIDLESGKRVKVKAAHMLMRFDKPGPQQLLADAQALAAAIELDLAWEFAPAEEFGFADLAREYFSANPSTTEQAAMLLALFEAPHYFRRAGKGRFRKASAEVVQQALAAIAKREALQRQIDDWANELAGGNCPDAVREQLFRILFKPDKNAAEYKAVVQASRQSQRAPMDLLQHADAIDSPYAFHWHRFLFEQFPNGTDFPALATPPAPADLPLAEGVRAFSIDDSQTTEIDDALSVQGLGTGTVTVGIHIAAPALALAPGDALDEVARQRLSTVYMPGRKITMLPDAVVDEFTLGEGQARAAVSLYVQVDEASLTIGDSVTRVERVPIVANLRHDQLDDIVTASWLSQAAGPVPQAPALESLHDELSFLHRLAQHLKLRREEVRGKPEQFSRPDYNFRLRSTQSQPLDPAGPKGDEQVDITTRARGAPLDLIVAEAMILANSSWGEWLARLGVPAIYRSQPSMAPGVKVRMGTKAQAHAGIGVPSYAWSTSPLRRYVDLVNQWQIIAAARHGATAALVAPFKPRDANLLGIISAFEATYGAYNSYQSAMERFWTLRYIQQHGLSEIDATIIKDSANMQPPGGPALVRAHDLPLVLPVLGAQHLARGAQVRVRLGDIDLIGLEVAGVATDVLSQGCGLRDQTVDTDDADDDDSVEAAPMGAGLSIAADVDAPTAPVQEQTQTASS